MLKARRTTAAALVLGVGAVALTACFPLPPSVPAAPSMPPVSQPAPDPTTAPTESTDPAPTTTDDAPAPAGDLPFTVDDGLGDTWSFDVVELVANPPIESGAVTDGMFVVGVVLAGEHVEGTTRFSSCFDILVEGSDGETYDYADTLGSLTPEDDIFYVGSEDSFTRGVAGVELPEGVDPVRVTLRSTYGYPTVEDTVIEINP